MLGRNCLSRTTSPFAWTGTMATAPGCSTMLKVVRRPLGRTRSRSTRRMTRPWKISRSASTRNFMVALNCSPNRGDYKDQPEAGNGKQESARGGGGALAGTEDRRDLRVGGSHGLE